MTMHTLAIILLSSLAGIFLIAIIILTFIFGKVSVRDNPKKAYVFVLTGKHLSHPYKAKYSETTKKGRSFFYGKDKIVFLPAKYPEIYHKNKRAILIKHTGQLVASAWTDDVRLTTTENESLIYEMCASHIGADGMRAMKGRKTSNLIIIAIIAFVIGIIAVVGFNKFQEMQQNKQAQPAQQIQQPNLPTSIEVK